MKLLPFSVLFLVSCTNPLSERVENLEDRISEIEAEQESQRAGLLDRLNQVAVTTDNSDEVADIRAKILQTDVSTWEFNRLRDRVTALEINIGDWSQVVSSMQKSVYAVVHTMFVDDASDIIFTFIGTGFAVNQGTIVTNGHIIDALIDLDIQTDDFNERFGTDISTWWLAIQNLAITLKVDQNYYFIDQYSTHSQWDPYDLSSPDVGALHIFDDAYIYRRISLATYYEARRLKVGTRVATLGFPGELQGGDLDNLNPVATFKDGTISALRDGHVVQHNLDLSGGTSGSPIFNTSGKVVAINNAGISGVVLTLGGGVSRISQAALGFGIRADKIHEVLRQARVTAKPIAPAAIPFSLDGKDIRSLDIGTVEDDLMERLTSVLLR